MQNLKVFSSFFIYLKIIRILIKNGWSFGFNNHQQISGNL
jgi:hypothetical protein